MAKYELSDVQVRNLRAILADANIKGKDAGAILEIVKAISIPIQEINLNDTKKDDNIGTAGTD